MANDAQVVETSATQVLSSLNEEQRRKWMETGELPEEKPKEESKKETPAESSPAAKQEVAEPKEAKPPAEPAPAEPEGHKGKRAEARIKELLAENKKLEARLAEVSKTPTAEPAKKEEAPAKPQRHDIDSKTGMPLYTDDAAFEAAREEWLTKKITADVQKQVAKQAEDTRRNEEARLTAERWVNSLKIAAEKHPDLDEVLEADDKGIIQNKVLKESIKAGTVLDGWLTDSEVGVEILYYLAKNPAEIERINRLGPFQAARALTKLEDELSGVKAEKKTEPAPAEKPPEKKVSKAPSPATNVDGKSTAPADEIGAAVAAEDFSRFQKAANEEDLRKRRK